MFTGLPKNYASHLPLATETTFAVADGIPSIFSSGTWIFTEATVTSN